METKGYKSIVWALIFLGCMQSLAVLNGNLPLYLFSKSSSASPMSAAFNGLNGVEFWALDIKIYVESDQGEKKTLPVDARLADYLDYPYFVRITYAFPFAFSEINPKPIAQEVMKKYLCHDSKFQKSLGISGRLTYMRITSQEKINPAKTHSMEQVCETL